MKTKDFINALEAQQIVPKDIVSKLRSKIEQTDKDVSAKSVAKYLIDKGYLSKFQARQILTGALKPAAAKEELDLQVSAEEVADTNELLKDLNPAGKVPNVTREFNPDDNSPATPDASIEVVNVDVEQTIQQGFEAGYPEVPAEQGFDPLGGNFDSQYGDAVEEESPLDAFKGKKGKRNQWDSKWIFIGSALLALLIMVGVILAFTIFKADSAKMWETANENFNNGRYPAAIEGYQRFIDSFPNDDKVHDAKVKIANSELRIPYDSKQWGTALTRSQSILPKLQEELEAAEKFEKFADLRSELGVILPGTALGFTRKGLEADDVEVKKEQLKLAQDTMVLIDDPAYVPGSEKRKPGVNKALQELSDNVSTIQRQIKMEYDYVAAVEAMNSLTSDGDTTVAFQTFEELVTQYPELKTREEIQEALIAISLKEAELVETIDVTLAAVEAKESPIENSVVFATKSGRKSIPGLSNEMLVPLIDGSLYGIKAVDGNVVWRKFVGVETTIDPVWLDPNDECKSDIIAVDSAKHDLMRISPMDGNEVWRVSIGEPFARPHVSSIGLLVTTHSGKVMVIDPNNGSCSKAAKVPKKASVSGVMIEGEPFIYQIADNSNIYVISTVTMTCREVYYLGHNSDSVSVPPFVFSGHIVVPVNAARYCNLEILRPLENGMKLDRAQGSIRMNGQVNTPIFRMSRWGLVMSDEGDLRMLEVNKAADDDPVSVVVKQKISSQRKARSVLKAVPGQLWISGAGLRRFKIQKAAGAFKEDGVSNNLDLFTGSTNLVGDTLFHVRRRHASSLASVSAVDSESLEEIWRTDLGAPLAGPPISDGSDMLAVSAQGDVFRIDDETISAGVSNSPVVRGSTVVQSLVFENVVEFGDKLVMTGPLDRRSILTVDLSESPPKKLAELQKPADRPACQPIAFGNELLVPTEEGQVFRVNTETGQSVGAPFGKLFPNTKTNWRRPTVVGDNRFLIANAQSKYYLVEAIGNESLQKVDEMEQPGDLLSPLLKLGENVYCISRDDSGDRIISIPVADQLEVVGEADLPGGYVLGPVKISDELMLVGLDSGEFVCVNNVLDQMWVASVPENGNDKLAGSPVVVNGKLIMAFVSGTVTSVDIESGDVLASIDVGQPISHPPVAINGKYFLTGADGTLHQLRDTSLFE